MKCLLPIILIFFLSLPGASFVMASSDEASPGHEGLDLNKAEEQKTTQVTTPKRAPILRATLKAVTPEEIRAMLKKYNFYATCWNNSKDFCNPEGDFQNHFIDNQNGTMTDKTTGLMWQNSGSPGVKGSGFFCRLIIMSRLR